MAELMVQFVRPDRIMFEGPVASVILATPKGELGIWPGRRPIICALGDGVVRINRLEANGGGTVRVVVSGGYAEVDNRSAYWSQKVKWWTMLLKYAES